VDDWVGFTEGLTQSHPLSTPKGLFLKRKTLPVLGEFFGGRVKAGIGRKVELLMFKLPDAHFQEYAKFIDSLYVLQLMMKD
jgi:hypothetical protein